MNLSKGESLLSTYIQGEISTNSSKQKIGKWRDSMDRTLSSLHFQKIQGMKLRISLKFWISKNRLQNRKKDLDNLTKPVLDSLKRIGRIEYDIFIYHLEVAKFPINGEEEVHIVIIKIRIRMDFLKLVLGVEISRENFVPTGIVYALIASIVSYVIFFHLDFLSVIDSMLELSNREWYIEYLTKFSFFMIPVTISIRSLFSTFQNPLGRFLAVFVVQIIGFVGTTVVSYLQSGFIITSQNIPEETKFLYGLLPFVISIMIMGVIRGIYAVEYFDEKRFFNS